MNHPELTDQEHDLLVRIANGQSNKAIGRAYAVTGTCAGRYVRRLCERLGARDRAHLVGLAFAAELLTEADVTPAVSAA